MSAAKSISNSLGTQDRGVADDTDGQRPFVVARLRAAGDGVLQRIGHLVEVAGLDTATDAPRVDVDAQRHPAVHRDRQRLRATHPAEAGSDRDRAGQRAVELAPGDLGEALVRALQDPLRADVDPRTGGHLAVHRQAHGLEPTELVPVAPLGHQVGVGDQHPRCPLVRAEHADRLAGLHEHRLVIAQRRERANHRVERIPRSRRTASAAVHDEVVRTLGHLGVEVVHQHPHRRFLLPALAGQL